MIGKYNDCRKGENKFLYTQRFNFFRTYLGHNNTVLLKYTKKPVTNKLPNTQLDNFN